MRNIWFKERSFDLLLFESQLKDKINFLIPVTFECLFLKKRDACLNNPVFAALGHRSRRVDVMTHTSLTRRPSTRSERPGADDSVVSRRCHLTALTRTNVPMRCHRFPTAAHHECRLFTFQSFPSCRRWMKVFRILFVHSFASDDIRFDSTNIRKRGRISAFPVTATSWGITLFYCWWFYHSSSPHSIHVSGGLTLRGKFSKFRMGFWFILRILTWHFSNWPSRGRGDGLVWGGV